MPLGNPTPESRSAPFSTAPSNIPNLHFPAQASMPPPTPSFSADGLTSYFREKIEAIRLVRLSCPLSPPSPSAPLTHLYPALLPSSSLKQRLPKPNVSTCGLGAQSLQAPPKPGLSVTSSPKSPSPRLRCPFPISYSLPQVPTANPVLCSNHYAHPPPPSMAKHEKSSLH